jgi:hypothetical protein
MILFRFAVVVSLVLALGLLIPPKTAISAAPQIAEKADQVVSVKTVTARADEVSGEVVNNSKQTLRNVQLQILYSWRWNNEMHPGTDDLGRAVYHTIEGEIAPGQSAPFSYKPSPPVTARKDGHFDITVKVVDFTQVYR